MPLYNPATMKYYTLRDRELQEYDPATDTSRPLTRDPINSVSVDPKGNLIYTTDDKVAVLDPVTGDTKVITAITEPVDDVVIEYETKPLGGRPGDKDGVQIEEPEPEPDKQYVFYTSDDKVVKVNVNDPTDKQTIVVPGATSYLVDPKV